MPEWNNNNSSGVFTAVPARLCRDVDKLENFVLTITGRDTLIFDSVSGGILPLIKVYPLD